MFELPPTSALTGSVGEISLRDQCTAGSGENVAHDSVEHGVLCFGEFGFHLFAREFGFDRLSRRRRLRA